VKRKPTLLEEYIQMLAMRKHLQAFLTVLPKTFTARNPGGIVHALIVDLERRATFPQAHYALADRLLTPKLARVIESAGKHWVGQLEGTCPIQWEGPWSTIGKVAKLIRHNSPQSFREVSICDTDGVSKILYIFTRSLRVDNYGRKRIVIAYENADLVGTPLFLFTDALYWEGHRIMQTWQYCWEEHMFRFDLFPQLYCPREGIAVLFNVFPHGDESPCYSTGAPSMGLASRIHPAPGYSAGIDARVEKRNSCPREVYFLTSFTLEKARGTHPDSRSASPFAIVALIAWRSTMSLDVRTITLFFIVAFPNYHPLLTNGASLYLKEINDLAVE